MKIRRLFFTFLLSLAAFQFCFSQEKPKAVLFEEFGNINCEELLARMDAFYNVLSNDPSSQGYIIIYGKGDETVRKLSYELLINGSIKFRNFDKSRIVRIRGAERENLEIELWKVPAGAEKPVFS